MKRCGIIPVCILFLFSSCFEEQVSDDLKQLLDADKPNPAVERQLEEKRFTGEKKYYHENGKLKTVIRYNEGYREGASVTYYKNGKLCLETEFKKGLKHGKYAWYFETGKAYRIANYKNNLLDGTFTEYQRTGSISLQVTYKNGNPCGALKTYDGKGKLKEPYTLEVTHKGYNAKEGIYTLVVAGNANLKNPLYYVAKPGYTGCFDDTKMEGVFRTGDNGEGVVEIPMPPGETLTAPVTFICIGELAQGIPAMITKEYTIKAKAK